MSLECQPYYVQDFHGGITDLYLAASPYKFKTGNNLVILPYGDVGNIGKLDIRQGSEIWSLTNPQIPTGAYRIGNLWFYKGFVSNGSAVVNFKDLLVQSKNQVFYVDNELNFSPGNWVTVTGDIGLEVVNLISTPASPGTIIYNNNHVANGDIVQLSAITGTLPSPYAPGTNYYVINRTNSQFDLSLTPGGLAIDTTSPLTADKYAITRITTNNVYNILTTESNNCCRANWKDFVFTCSDDGKTFPQKIYTPGYGQRIKTQNAGLPAITVGTTSGTTTPNTYNYVYAFNLEASYTTKNGTITYTDVGPPVFQQANFAVPVETALPIFRISPQALWADSNNYPTSVRVRVSRTKRDGTVFYWVNYVTPAPLGPLPGELATTSFANSYIGVNITDAIPDTTLEAHPKLYTEGGIVSFGEVPSSKFIHIVNDTGYYGFTTEYTTAGAKQSFPNRVMQSIPAIPGSTNGSFFTEFREEVKGISSYRGTPMVFCDNSIYRIDGQFDELGRGGMFPQELSVEASCISHNSIVQTEAGLFWAGKNGFFWSDGYKVRRINEGWPDRYATLVASDPARLRIQGKLDSFNRRVYWTMQQPGEVDCNVIYELDLNFGLSDDMAFTSMSGFDDGASFAPTAIEFDEDVWYRSDRRGYIFNHNSDAKSDPKINTMIPVADWINDPIIYTYESAATNFGMSFTRYWVPRVIVQLKNISNLSLQPDSNNDDTRLVGGLAPVIFRGNTVWGDPSIVWGDNAIIWNLSGFIEAQRRFPAGSLRCSYKQIVLTNAYIILYKSDLWGNATLDTTLKTVTLINYPMFSWPTDAINLSISFVADGYVREFAIINRTANILTFSDAANDAPPSGVTEWVIRGFPLNEVFSLQSYTLHFAPLGKTQPQYQSSDAGGNADG